jgi:hypothetical protein
MPETANDALVVAKRRRYLEGLPAVQATGANLSSYRKHLRQMARMTDSWVGVIVPEAEAAPRFSFYPFIRVATHQYPEAQSTGRLMDLLFLQPSRFIYQYAVKDAAKNALMLVTPTLPFATCPAALIDEDPCNSCGHWAHCATGQMMLARAFFIRIEPFHFKKVCNYGATGWREPGEVATRLSYRYIPGPPQFALKSADLQAVPQFEPYYS